MRSEQVLFFTQKEEEFVDLLIGIGIRRNLAKVLVYLSSTNEATSRDIERGTDLRQPEVSIAMSRLHSEGWVESRESKAESKGRPVKIYRLEHPINAIIDQIEADKRSEVEQQHQTMQQLRDLLSQREITAQ